MINYIREKIIKPFYNYFLSIGKERYYVFGDSHTEVFDYLNRHNTKNVFFDITWVGGATALGLRNPNSKTNALVNFKTKIDKIKDKNKPLYFLLGEVDTGFVIWYRSAKYNESVDKQLKDTIEAYFDFLKWVKSLNFQNIIVVSAPLPTIKDNQDWGDVANLRSEVNATQLERTELTIKYNTQLKLRCGDMGFKFIDCDNYLIDHQTNIIKKKFLNKNPNNHHLDLTEYSAIIAKLLFDK